MRQPIQTSISHALEHFDTYTTGRALQQQVSHEKNGRAHGGGYPMEEERESPRRWVSHEKRERESPQRWISHEKRERESLQQWVSHGEIKSPLKEALGAESATRYESEQALRNERPISSCPGRASCFQKATRAQSRVDPLARPIDYFILEALLARHPTKALHRAGIISILFYFAIRQCDRRRLTSSQLCNVSGPSTRTPLVSTAYTLPPSTGDSSRSGVREFEDGVVSRS